MANTEIHKLTHIGDKARPPDKDGQRYMPVVLETYRMTKSGKSHNVHARPIKGQGKFKPSMDAECSRNMRKSHPIGTMFLAWCIVIDREGTDFVYTYHDWPHPVVGK